MVSYFYKTFYQNLHVLQGGFDLKKLTLIVPCFNEQEALPFFYKEAISVLKNLNYEYELLFINDGSRDGTLAKLRELAKQDERVRYISFSRNFGKESGMYAGLENATGDYVVIMDADLQHPPAFLPKMYNIVLSGEYDCATTRRVSRKGEPKLLSWFSRKFYKIMKRISQTEIVDGAQDFRFMTRQMVDSILAMKEYNRFSKGIFSWVGFRTKYIEYENVERAAGTSTWSFWKLFRYALDGFFAFSTAPLTISSILGVASCLIAFIMIIVIIIKKLAFGDPVQGFATLICAIFFMGGLQLFCVGIAGQYLAKTYLETKKRPIYLVQETEKDARKDMDTAVGEQ